METATDLYELNERELMEVEGGNAVVTFLAGYIASKVMDYCINEAKKADTEEVTDAVMDASYPCP